MENNENHEQFFGTPIFSMEKPEWVEKTNKICQPHLDESHASQIVDSIFFLHLAFIVVFFL